jgi:hypothetical protein
VRITLHLEETSRFPNEVHEVQGKQAIVEGKKIVGFGHYAFNGVEETIKRLPLSIDF